MASPRDNELLFVFKDGKGAVNFKNDFVYVAKANTWEWRMDNVANGVAKSFESGETDARVKSRWPTVSELTPNRIEAYPLQFARPARIRAEQKIRLGARG